LTRRALSFHPTALSLAEAMVMAVACPVAAAAVAAVGQQPEQPTEEMVVVVAVSISAHATPLTFWCHLVPRPL
jgi:hypothetical protein